MQASLSSLQFRETSPFRSNFMLRAIAPMFEALSEEIDDVVFVKVRFVFDFQLFIGSMHLSTSTNPPTNYG